MGQYMNRLLAPLLVALFAPVALAEAPRVVCFGDSITKQGYPELVGKAIDVEAVNAGVGGNNTVQGLKRMKADVLDKKPAIVVIFFGTNDCRPSDESAHVPVEQYQKNLEQMIDQSQKIGAKVIVCTPPPINPEPYFKRHKKEKIEAEGGLEKVLAKYRAAAIAAAETKKATVVDLNQLFGKQKQEEWLSTDGVHPSEKGKAMIATYVGEAIKPLLGKSQ
jgi:lysophospholipase L1-like esterase